MSPNGEKIDSTLLGVVYLSESETKYHFRKPNDEKEIMYSSKVSGDNKAFSFNQVSDMKFSVYENLITLDGLSDRPFISPINENALLSYRYKLLGTTFEDGKMLNKIEITPKRKTDPCFRGIIYIQENTWRVHSADAVSYTHLDVYKRQLYNSNRADATSILVSSQWNRFRWACASPPYRCSSEYRERLVDRRLST